MSVLEFIGAIIVTDFLVIINITTWLRVRRIEKALKESEE